MNPRRAFTLVELLVVIAIIGFMASVVLASLTTARSNARNAQRISVVQSYKVALELAFDTYNKYPDPGTGTWNCLGQYTGNQCFNNGYSNSATLDGIMNGFVPGHPTPDPAGILFNGLAYLPNGPNSYIFLWFLEGVNKNCSPGFQYSADYYGLGTYCEYVR